MKFDDYRDLFKTVKLTRDEAGVVTVQLHSKGESLWWSKRPHREIADMFGRIAEDRDVRVVIITGAGDHFITLPDDADLTSLPKGLRSATDWEQTISEGNRIVNGLMAIEVPVISAVNGPVCVHSEIAVLGDIVLCTPETYFQDRVHFPSGLVPGDGVHVIWPMLLGVNRGRNFLLRGEKIFAEEAKRLGVVAEIVTLNELLNRAHQIATEFAGRNPVLLRHTRQVLTLPIKKALNEHLHLGLALEAVASLSGREFFTRDPTDE